MSRNRWRHEAEREPVEAARRPRICLGVALDEALTGAPLPHDLAMRLSSIRQHVGELKGMILALDDRVSAGLREALDAAAGRL
jgi:hypothetical protein